MKTTALVTTAFAASLAALFAATPAFAASPPKFTASCPTGITVKSNGQGRVRINGTKAVVKTFNANAWEARLNGVSIDITREGGEIMATYTGKGGANGICQVSGVSMGNASSGGSATDMNGVPSKDREACLTAVSRKTNNNDVEVLDAYGSEANNEVTIGVGPQRAKWQCLVKDGRVGKVMSLTNEGGL